MQTQVKPLGDRTVGFEKDGVKFETSFRRMDDLLHQWQRNTLPPEAGNPGAYISRELGWSYVLSDLELIAFAKQLDQIREKWLAEMRDEAVAAAGLNPVPDPGIPEDAVRLFHERSSLDVGSPPLEVPRFQKTPVPAFEDQKQSPGVNPFDGEYDRAAFIVDTACMVLFLMRVNPSIEEWGLQMMQKAGCAPSEVEEAAQRIVATRVRQAPRYTRGD